MSDLNLEKLQSCTDEAKEHLRRAGKEQSPHGQAAHALTGLLTLAVGMTEQVLEQERASS